MTDRPNILLVLTDQQRFPPGYESDEIQRFRAEELPGEARLVNEGVSFQRHYVMSAACAPSRTSLLTGQYPSWHGVAQTDGVSKRADNAAIRWLEPDTVPTLGDWFRTAGYRTYYKGKWHVSHATIESPDGSGELQTLDSKGRPLDDNIRTWLDADLLDEYGFSEWVGPEPHGLGPQNTGTVRDPFTADETIDLLRRLDEDDDSRPWLTVCSFLNPHDIALFGIIALTQGLRYENRSVPPVADAPTRHEDLSTKPTCQQSYIDVWPKMYAPQPFIETHRRFYYQLQREVDAQLERVLDALRASPAFENTIIVFTSDHGDMLGAHGGMHQKWHNAYDETTRVPLHVSSPLLPSGARTIDAPTSHADILPTLLGLAGIDQAAALETLATTHTAVRPLAGRDLSSAIQGASTSQPTEPVLFTTDDEISEGDDVPASPVQRVVRKLGRYSTIAQPNHVETVIAEVDVNGEQHVVKFSRYHDDASFWTEPDVRDERLQDGGKLVTHTERAPDEFELYDLTLDPHEERNLVHPTLADEHARELANRMHALLVAELDRKRVTPATGVVPGYRPPSATPA
jgi:arylsulfatase A-like enzyme